MLRRSSQAVPSLPPPRPSPSPPRRRGRTALARGVTAARTGPARDTRERLPAGLPPERQRQSSNSGGRRPGRFAEKAAGMVSRPPPHSQCRSPRAGGWLGSARPRTARGQRRRRLLLLLRKPRAGRSGSAGEPAAAAATGIKTTTERPRIHEQGKRQARTGRKRPGSRRRQHRSSSSSSSLTPSLTHGKDVPPPAWWQAGAAPPGFMRREEGRAWVSTGG